MANLAPKVIETESLLTPQETPVVDQPTRRVTATSSRKAKPKRVRTKKLDTSLTRTTRRVARSKAPLRSKDAPPAPKITVLNRLVNISVVVAVFVTALAIQRIVPTEPMSTPKVEALSVPEPAPVTTVQVVAAPPTTNSGVIATTTKRAIATTKMPTAKPKIVISQRHDTPLNSGGTEDLDSESARQTYKIKTKLATRTPTQ